MNYYDKNVEVMKAYKGDLYKRIMVFNRNDYHDNIYRVNFIEAKDGTPVPVLSSEGREFRLNSSYRPLSEAARWAAQYEDRGELAVFVMFGLGSGMFTAELFQFLGNNNRLIIYEPSAELFLKGMEKYDWSFLLMDSRISIVVEGFNDMSFMDYLQGCICWNNLNQVKIAVHPGFDKLFPRSCSAFCHTYEDARDTVIRNRNTDKRFAEVKIVNMLHNWKYLKQGFGIMQLKEAIPDDIPFILVAAGPSLLKNIDYLKRAKGHAVIIGVDTALPALYAHGIEPDLFISIDPVKSMQCFSSDHCRHIPFLCNTCTNPGIMDLHTGQKVFLKDDKFIEEIYQHLKIPSFRYNLGGSVATAAFAVCAELTRKVVILVGQDLAYSEDRKSHVNHSEEFRVNTQFLVEDINGKMVQSRSDWYTYLQWFNGAVEYCDYMKVVDATEGGARIAGADIMTLNEALDTFCRQEIDAAELLSDMKPMLNEDQKVQMDIIMQNCREEIMTVRNLSDEGITLCDLWFQEIITAGMMTEQARAYNCRLYQINETLMGLLIFRLLDIYMVLCDPAEETSIVTEDKEAMEQAQIVNDTRGLYNALQQAAHYIETIMEAQTD